MATNANCLSGTGVNDARRSWLPQLRTAFAWKIKIGSPDLKSLVSREILDGLRHNALAINLSAAQARTSRNFSTNESFRATESATDFGCTKIHVREAISLVKRHLHR